MAVNTWQFERGKEKPKNNGRQSMHTFEVHVNAHGKPVATFLRMVD